MPEKFEESLKEGYRTWRKNMKVGIPPLASLLLQGIILLISLLLVIIVLVFYMSSLQYESESFINYLDFLQGLFLLILVLSLVLVLLLIFIDSFFTAGAVGMAREVTEKGTTELSDMLSYGRKKVMSVYLAKIIVILLVYIIPLILITVLVTAFGLINMLNVSLSLAFILLGVFIFYSFILDIILYPVSYAIVIKDIGAIDGVRMGYQFALKNKLAVVLMWVAVGGISTVYNMITGMIASLFNVIGIVPYIGPVFSVLLIMLVNMLSMIIAAFLIGGLSVILWTRLILKRI